MKTTRAARVLVPDALRGLVIVFMALDHASHFVAQQHSSGEYWGGVFPVYDDPFTFLTRFVTHFCAPGFFLLMGLGMVMFARARQERGWTRWQIIRHFVIRGGVLIALQFLVVNQAWNLSPGGWGIEVYVGVLFALGGAMIVASLLLWLRPVHLLGLTLALLVGTELLVPDPALWGTGKSVPTLLLLLPGGILTPGGGILLWSNYQTLPWLELVTLGLVFGHWLGEAPPKAFGRAWKVGLACLVAFVIVRCLDGFGNIRPRMGDGWIDFFNLVKYPPSIAFTLLTAGVNLCLLWLLSRAGERVQRVLQPLVVLGQAPLFFYVQHLFLYATLGHLLAPRGTSLLAMVLVWLLGLFILYPLCLGYLWFKGHQPAHRGLRLVWDTAITVFGPVGLCVYWLYRLAGRSLSQRTTAPRWANVWGFIAATYVVSWLLWLPAILSRAGQPSLPLIASGAFVPSLMGILFTCLAKDRDGRRDFWRRVVDVRPIGWRWWAVILAIFPLAYTVSGVAYSLLGGDLPRFVDILGRLTNLALVAELIVANLLISGFSEELGWRGFALDPLQERWGALTGSLVLGLLHALWHTPLFLVPGLSQGEMGLFSLDYFLFVGMVPLGAVLMTWVYNNTQRSILSAVLLHFSQNFSLDLVSGLHGALPTLYWALFAATLALLVAAVVGAWGPRTLRGRVACPLPSR